MDRSQADPKLGEVKAVLQRLQTFSAEPDNAASQSEKSETSRADGSVAQRRALAAIVLTIIWAFVVLGLFWVTISPPGPAHPPVATIADATPKDPAHAPVAATVDATPKVPARPAATATVDATPKGPAISPSDASVGPPALRPSAPGAALDVAQGLLAKGQVQAARKQLLGLASEDADVAWMLARSYDPNVLAGIPAADAGPDIAQATRWYRAWHAAAVTQGMVPSSVSVERIIGSMR